MAVAGANSFRIARPVPVVASEAYPFAFANRIAVAGAVSPGIPIPRTFVASGPVSFAFPPCVALTLAFTQRVAIPSIGSPGAAVSRTTVVRASRAVVRSMGLALSFTPPHCIPIAIAGTPCVAVVVAKDDQAALQVPLQGNAGNPVGVSVNRVVVAIGLDHHSTVNNRHFVELVVNDHRPTPPTSPSSTPPPRPRP